MAVLLNALLAQHSQFGQRHAKIRTRGFGHAERNGAVSSSRMPTITSPPWGTATKRIVAVGVVVLALLLAREIGSTIWTGIILAVVLGYLLSPIVRFVEQRIVVVGGQGLRRTISVVVAWVILLGVFTLIAILIIPAISAQFRDFADELPRLVQSIQEDLEDVLSRSISIGNYTFVPWDELQTFFMPSAGEAGDGEDLAETLRSTLLSMTDSGIDVLSSLVTFLVSFALVLMMVFYLMRDGPSFAQYVVNSTPESYRGDVERLMYELGLIWNAYLRGQLMLGLAVAVATYLAALILGLPQPLVLGVLAGFLEFIPNIGPTLSAIPAIFFALLTPSSTIPGLDAGLIYALVVALAYVAIQQLEALFLVPRILGGSLDLHPVIVLAAVWIGATVVGVLGVILAAPMVATIRLGLRYLRGKLLDEEVFPMVSQPATRRGGFAYSLVRYFLNRRFRTLQGEVERVRSRSSASSETDALPSGR